MKRSMHKYRLNITEAIKTKKLSNYAKNKIEINLI